jgi:ferredoxin
LIAQRHSTVGQRLTIAAADHQVGGCGRVLRRRDGEVVLDTLLRLGWTAPYACRRGGCGLCLIKLHRGRVRHGAHTDRALPHRAEKEERLGLACRAIPITPAVEIEFCRGAARQVVPTWGFPVDQAKEQ